MPFRMNNREKPKIYTHQIDPKTRAKVTEVIDNVGSWEKLAISIDGIETNDLFAMRREVSAGRGAAERLMRLVDMLNMKIVTFYRKLMETRHFSAAELLHAYIPENQRILEDDLPPEGDQWHQDGGNQLGSLVPPESEYNSIASQRSFPSSSCQPPTSHESLRLSLGQQGHHERDYIREQQAASDSWLRKPNHQMDGMLSNNLASMQLNDKSSKKKSVMTEYTNRFSNGYPYFPPQTYQCSREPTESPDQDTVLPDADNSDVKNNLSPGSSSNTGSDNILSGLTGSSSRRSSALELLNQGFSYEEIKNATNNFSQSNCLGEGHYGRVYRGTLHKSSYAIKVFKEFLVNGDETTRNQVVREIEALAKFRHDNIVQLCGFCAEPQLCLVYSYMINGSLADKLVGKTQGSQVTGKLLTWPQRSNILRGAAKAVFFLHDSSPPLVHGDIKSSNILLDKNLEPRLSDFGLAKMATGGSSTGILTHVTRRTASQALFGSRAYLPAEFLRDHKYNLKTDIFSFGVVILEVCTGKPAEIKENQASEIQYLYEVVQEARDLDTEGDEVPLMKVKDTTVEGWPDDLWKKVVYLGCQCTDKKKSIRPAMGKIVEELENIEVTYRKVKLSDKGTSEDLQKDVDTGSVRCDPSMQYQSELSINKTEAHGKKYKEQDSSPYEQQNEFNDRKTEDRQEPEALKNLETGDGVKRDTVTQEEDTTQIKQRNRLSMLSEAENMMQTVADKKHGRKVAGGTTIHPGQSVSPQGPKVEYLVLPGTCGMRVPIREGHIAEGESDMDDFLPTKDSVLPSGMQLTIHDHMESHQPHLPVPQSIVEEGSKCISERDNMVNKFKNKKINIPLMQHHPNYIQPHRQPQQQHQQAMYMGQSHTRSPQFSSHAHGRSQLYDGHTHQGSLLYHGHLQMSPVYEGQPQQVSPLCDLPHIYHPGHLNQPQMPNMQYIVQQQQQQQRAYAVGEPWPPASDPSRPDTTASLATSSQQSTSDADGQTPQDSANRNSSSPGGHADIRASEWTPCQPPAISTPPHLSQTGSCCHSPEAGESEDVVDTASNIPQLQVASSAHGLPSEQTDTQTSSCSTHPPGSSTSNQLNIEDAVRIGLGERLIQQKTSMDMSSLSNTSAE